MTISLSFSYNSPVKCHGETIMEPQHSAVYIMTENHPAVPIITLFLEVETFLIID